MSVITAPLPVTRSNLMLTMMVSEIYVTLTRGVGDVVSRSVKHLVKLYFILSSTKQKGRRGQIYFLCPLRRYV